MTINTDEFNEVFMFDENYVGCARAHQTSDDQENNCVSVSVWLGKKRNARINKIVETAVIYSQIYFRCVSVSTSGSTSRSL